MHGDKFARITSGQIQVTLGRDPHKGGCMTPTQYKLNITT